MVLELMTYFFAKVQKFQLKILPLQNQKFVTRNLKRYGQKSNTRSDCQAGSQRD